MFIKYHFAFIINRYSTAPKNESFTFIPTKGKYLRSDQIFLPTCMYFPPRKYHSVSLHSTEDKCFSLFFFYSCMHFSATHPPTMCLPALPVSSLPPRFFNLQSQIRLQISRLIPLIALKSPGPRKDPAPHMATRSRF